jgi:Uma2 family endonuclease
MVAGPREHATLAEYLALDARSDVKHELVAGTIVDMAGGSPAHSDLATNVTIELGAQLRGRPCRVNNSDLRIGRVDDDFRAYPDVAITCGARVTAEVDPNTVTNPTLVVEVTSDSTEGYDRGVKSAHYRQIASLQTYVLVSHGAVSVDVLTRAEGASWVLRTYGPGEVIELGAVGATLAVDAVYAGVVIAGGAVVGVIASDR